MQLGGPSWRVEFGRTDSTSRPSAQSADRNIPFATDDLSTISSLFASKGFSVREMVALSGFALNFIFTFGLTNKHIYISAKHQNIKLINFIFD